MEISKTECKRILRTLELKAYRSVVDALRAQGTLTVNKHGVLKSLAATLKVSDERYRSEMRRAANDDLLSTIAQSTSGKNTEEEWLAESMKKVPITPMIASHTAFTVLADAISDIVSVENENFSDSSESKNIIESYKSRNDENLKKYQSSKILGSLLKKRKDHHQNLIFSELENIKLNNKYHSSPIKSGYIEISYDENSRTVDTQDQDFSFDDTNSSFDTPTFSSFEKSSPPKKKLFSENPENASTSNSSVRRINSKSRSKVRRSGKKNSEKKISPSNTSKISNTGRKRNLRTKPFKKYTWNSVEIRSFEEENTEKARALEDIDDNLVNETRRNVEKNETSESSKESCLEISYADNINSKLLKSRKTKQRSRNRTKFVRQSKINRGRKKLKPDSVREVPSRTARLSSRNARRRNYARIASGDYDLLEFEKIRKVKNVEVEQIQEDIVKDEDEINETDDDSLSDSSAAPIEISYSNPAAPKSCDYDLDGVSSTYTETDDDMKPHTFNLIPASRRLKMLKKRAASPIGEETPTKQIALSSQSNNEQSVAPTAKASLLDINALKKVLAAQESSGNVTSSSLSDASDITDTKEISDASDRLLPEPKESKPPFLVPPRSVSEKKGKPKMKLSEASTIENLHSLLSKVKEGDLKRPSNDSNNKNKSLCRKKKERKSSPRSISPIVNNCSGSLIEVGSDTGSGDDNNYETVDRNSDSNDSILPENGPEIDGNVKPNNEVQNSDNLVENDTQTIEIVRPRNEEIDSKNIPENDIQIEETGKRLDESKQSESVSVNEDEVVSITLEDLENSVECHVSEQLIDIESADIIIGDSSEQNEQLILTDAASTAVSEMNNQHGSTIGETVKSVISSTVTIPIDKTEKKPNIVIVSSFQKNTEPLATMMNKQNTVFKSRQPNIKKLLAESADFVYKADADDPSLKQTLLKPPHLAPTTSSSGIPTIINSSKKFGKSPIKTANAINSKDSKTTNSNPNVLENKINQKNAITDSTFSKDRKFVLLDTKSITGSKSLLKPIKIIPKITIPSKTNTETISIPCKTMTEANNIPKITIPNKTKTEANCIVRKSSTMGIYSSLENLNKFASSTGSNTIKTIVVSKKSTSEIDPKRLVLSQALERSLKSIETVKNQFGSSAVNMHGNTESFENKDWETESTSNDSQKDNINSNLNEIITLFADDTSSNGDSESISSTEGLNEMKTFFSKNIIRKQS